MKRLMMAALAMAGALGAMAGASAASASDLMGVACTSPQPARCNGEQCNSSGALASTGNTADAGGRKFFLDYPCDLKPHEKVTVVLSLHGAGSIGNWQRHYFPIVDYVNKYRLVVITPTAATMAPMAAGGPGVRRWVADADDAHLQAITDSVIGALGQGAHPRLLAGGSPARAASPPTRSSARPSGAGKVDGFLSPLRWSGGRRAHEPALRPAQGRRLAARAAHHLAEHARPAPVPVQPHL